MARGRRKGTKSRVKSEVANSDKDQSCKSPKDIKVSRGVNGRLSHASPIIPEKELITHYFHPVPSPDAPEKEKEPSYCESAVSSAHEIEIVEIVKANDGKTTPHKIQHNTQVIQSPSSALQQLRITYTPKKSGKSRQRLNPSQAGNQQVCVPKPACCAKQNGNHELSEYFPVRRSERKTKRTVLQEKQHRMEAAVLADCEEGLEVHNFEGKGRGIVATRFFCKGEFVVEYAGELIDMTEAKVRERMYAQDQNTGCYMYYFRHRNTQYCVDATSESGRLGRLVNHSRNGNLQTKTLEIKSRPRLVLIAREDISPGEEVTYDYGDRSKESIRYHPWLLS
ncbi:hypothetical protein R5R35_007075 [Gryllus longicercus]|uniref:[histone H4]-lysine(20) N-methyltransferase n=1 Tax=Gryllus longicercus TaxID=2509291 RepID=A0AAN9Z1K4_9ORTH